MKPKVTLLSRTQKIVATIYAIWQASKDNEPIQNIEDINENEPKVFRIFEKVIDSKIPVAENISFTFLLENISISLREQLVRHRIGVKVDGRIGTDMVPDLADSTFWSQSMRILDMGHFADEGRFHLPASIAKCERRTAAFEKAMAHAQEAYRELVGDGVPLEDARDVIPLAATHRITWTLNLSALQHILGKRGCWILQLGLWEPIIRGMVDELATKVHPYFRNLINPPCIKGDKFHECVFKLDNERRVDGQDKLPPCSLYMHNHTDEVTMVPPDQVDAYAAKAAQYMELWDRNPLTGNRR